MQQQRRKIGIARESVKWYIHTCIECPNMDMHIMSFNSYNTQRMKRLHSINSIWKALANKQAAATAVLLEQCFSYSLSLFLHISILLHISHTFSRNMNTLTGRLDPILISFHEYFHFVARENAKALTSHITSCIIESSGANVFHCYYLVAGTFFILK